MFSSLLSSSKITTHEKVHLSDIDVSSTFLTRFSTVFVLFTEFSNGFRDKACDMLVVIDETLAETYGGNVDVIINLVDEHIDGLNDIFHRTVFRDHLSRYFFYAKNVELWYDFCEDCNHTQTVFLTEFSR